MVQSQLLLKEHLSPATYFHIVDSVLPEDWMMWEPETVWAEIEAETGLSFDEIGETTKNKIMAYRMANNSSAPWEDWHVFLNVCQAFNDVVPNVDVAQVCSPSQVAWTLTKLMEIHPDWKFSESVKAIAAVMLFNDGVCWSPGILGDIANDHLFYLQRHYEQLPEFVKKLADNYVEYMDSKHVEGDSPEAIHTVRLKAIDRSLRIKQVMEEAAEHANE